MMIILETKRLVLKNITLEDKENMFKMYANPEVQKYTGEPVTTSLEEMEEAIKERAHNYEKYGYGRWATFLKPQMQFVGWAGLAYLPEFDEIDLGYRFLPEFWGKGIATEVSFSILEYGFNTLQLSRIIAIAMKEHKASMRVMEKIGMQFEKFAPYEIGSIDAAWYSIDKDTFQKKNERD